jgi:putative addiction module antidote
MPNTRLTKMGNSVAMTLPRDVLQASGFRRGDQVQVEAEEGRVTVTKADTSFGRTMDAGRAFMRRYSTALAILAK